jgi:DNA-binding MurR/RpiR family transcriptional regulator
MDANMPISEGCLVRLRGIYPSLTKAEQKIADYILAYPGEAVHRTITELADVTGSAEATIFRLCKKIGFRGYQAFKIALAGDIYSPLQTIYEDVKDTDDVGVLTRKVFQGIIDGLQDTLKILREEDANKAVELLANAPRIDVYGMGGSAVIAADVQHKFMRFGIPVFAFSDTHMQISSAALLREGDVVIAISHSGSNKDLIESLMVAKSSGAKILAITSYLKSPISKIADITLHSATKETAFRSEAMASRLIQLAVLDVLYIGVFLKKQVVALENVKKIREAISMKRL